MARRLRVVSRSSGRSQGLAFQRALDLYRLLPLVDPPFSPCVPVSSLAFLDVARSVISFSGTRLALFHAVCGVIGASHPRFEFRVLSILDCFRRDFDRIARVVQSRSDRRRRLRLFAPPLCPSCGVSMVVSDLRPWPRRLNRLGFSSHWVCLHCNFDFFSCVPVDPFGFPLASVPVPSSLGGFPS